jgi:excinuclease ABC subunit C
MGQMLLLPDPRPLDRRLGGKFFRKVPRRPGVYLMKDAQDKIVYVGKAKDLKQRLNNYRVANPDRMPRRHLKLVNEVADSRRS